MFNDEDRREIFEAFERALGPGTAAKVMTVFPPVPWEDIARRSDIAGVRGEIAELRGEMRELRGEIREMRGEMKEQLARMLVANVGIAFGTAGLVLAAAKLA